MPSPMMTMIYSPSTNLVDTVIDEVALEGLDGITLEALWQRLALRLQIPHPLPTPLREQVWSICISTKDLLFYELESPRGPLVIYDRYEFVDPDLGTILEPEDLPDDIYEHYPIDDIKTGVRGSCKSYHTRKLIDSIRTISLASAEEKFGQNLVIVGAQPTRQNALMGDTASPTLELTIVQYCFLERVGRSRYHGEVTQGKRSLSILGEESKSLFYHRKFLSKHKMITKQTHYQKSASAGHGSSGTLVHLPRFFVERKPKMIYLAESIVEILRTRDNYIADYSEIKKKLQLDRTIKNLFKLAIFQKIVRTDLLVPYRTLYPHADISEWQRKAMPLEKKIKAIQLLDPNIDVNELWNKDDLEEEESPQVYDLDISKQKINEPLLTQANLHVESANCDGLSQTELGKCMGLTKLQARTILRNLAKMNIVGTYMNDVGRQRMTKYVSKRFEKNSAISKQFKTEMIKMKALTKPQTLQNHPPSVPSPPVSIDPPPEAPNPEPVDERMERMEIEQLPSPKTSKENLRVLFTSANRILNKYKLYKLHKYQLTCQDLSGEHSKHLHSRTRKLSDQMKKISLPPAKRRKIDSTKFSESDTCEISLQEIKIPVNPRARLRSLLKELHSDNPRTTGNITYRILKRANMIIESVKEHKVIDDTTRLMRMINEEEEREGYDVKIDKKSLIRLLQKLAGDNLVKHINLTLTSKGRKKMITFICDPSIDVNHTVIQSAVEQAKIKFCVMRCPRSKANHSQADNEKITQKPLKKKSKQDMDPLEVPADIKYDPKAGKRYGYSPKFVRMQVIHLLLYHVIYDYPEPSVLSQEEEINRLRASGYQIDSKMEKEMGRIYDNEVSWKMFIPPLAPHEGWPRGWALMCDILHRMPLSIFLKFCKIPYEMADLNYYLDDPIRKHTLIKELPTLLRNALLQNRKYIYSFHETISRLCFIGLVQFGPQKLKHKDQVFLYLNRRSELYDTTTSAPSYHKISEDSYPRYSYYFDKAETVEKYWYDMWSFCINTHLGGRLVVLGTDIVLEELTKKPEMMETLKPRSPEEAKLLDIGILPGDKRGAAGIDSAFFAHLKRNWNWDNFQRKDSLPKDNIPEKTPVQTTKRNMHLSKIEANPLKFTDFKGLKKSGPTNLDVNELKVPKNQKASLFITSDKHLRHKILTSKMSKQNAIVRRVLPKKQVKKSSTKVKYDDIDYSALQKMQKLRVDWDPREDNILLVCKVVMTYLCPNPRRQLINCTAVRDVLRSYSSSSHNKTSRACQRRLLYMLKKPQTMQSVGLGVEEIKQNYYVHKRYDNIVDKIRQENRHPNDSESKIVEVFKTLVSYVAKKYYDISESGTKEVEHMPKTIQEFNLFYHVTHPQRPHAHLGFTQNVKSVNDIHTATINSVIYSSMCCGKDRRSWAYQLFRIYQQYSEILLKNAMGKIRADHMVCVKKHYLNAIKKFGNCMPMSSSQYQLSTGYIYKFQTKISPEVYDDVFEFLKTVVKGYRENTLGEAGGVECVPPTGGMVMGIPEYFIEGKIDFNVEIPDHVIMLDPKLQEYDETYIRIVKRYQDILTSLEQSDLQSVEPSISRIHSATSMQKAEDSPDWERIKIDVETAPAKSTRKVGPMKTHWTHKELRKPSREDSSTDYDSNIEEGKSDLDDDVDNDYIKLQDGTIIPITKGDIEIAKSTPVDDHVHQAFLKTRKEAVEDVSAFSVIDQLKEIVTGETTKMCVDRPEKRAKRRQERDTFEDNSNFPPKSPTSKTPKYLNDVIAKMDYRKDSKFAQNQRDKSSGNTGSPHTGLALLTMREELNEDVPDSHHAHEYFVVNSFGIYYSFPHLRVKTEEQSESCESLIKSGGLLVVEDSVYKKVLADLRKFAVFPKEFPEYDRITELLMIKGIEKADVDVVYEYVESKQEQGATLEELVENFHRKLQVHLYEILSFLTDYRLLLRSGVTRMHYIHHKFVDPWLIQSIRIMRLQKESLPPVPPGTVYVLNPDSEAVAASEPSESPGCKKNPSIQVSPILSTSEHQKNLPKKRTCLLQTKDIYNAAKKLDMNSAEDINVVVRPWIQIDGLVNRKGLEQMLGAVLGHCLMHPGIMLPRVQERFIPALQPYHTRELVEILVKLGCLGIKVLQKGPVNLFSQSTSTILTQPIQGHGESEYDNEMIIEPTIGAVIKFSSFIRKNRDQL